VVPPLARRWAVEHGLVLAAPHGERDGMEGMPVSSSGTAIHGGTVVVFRAVRVFSICGVVVMGVREAPVLHLLGEGRLKLPSPLGVVRNSSTESPIIAHHRVDASM
jgi:hypothetical protein